MRSLSWREWLGLPTRKWKLVLTVENGDEIPERIPKHGVVLVGTMARPKWIALECPCDLGHRIMLNTDASRRPYWSIGSFAPITVSPSIDDVTPTRRCHFLLKQGRICWVRGLERSWKR
jgi:hypothetical protein